MTSGVVCSTSGSVGLDNTITYLNTADTITADGTVTLVCVRVGGTVYSASCSISVLVGDFVACSTVDSTTKRVSIFRSDGTNYNYVGSQTIGSIPSNAQVEFVTDPHLASSKTGDITSNSTIASWGTGYVCGVAYATVSNGDNVYVDINKSDDTGNGFSFANAKKTMKAGWDILNASGTMHVASGDYSAQTTIAYNKSWKLSPEDPNSLGYRNVKIPKST